VLEKAFTTWPAKKWVPETGRWVPGGPEVGDTVTTGVRRTRVCEPPAEIAATPSRPASTSGVLCCVVVPSPSWPEAFRPQASNVAFDFRAMAWEKPALSDTTPLPGPSPLTWTGVAWSVGAVPSPSSPEALLPQAATVPVDLVVRP